MIDTDDDMTGSAKPEDLKAISAIAVQAKAIAGEILAMEEALKSKKAELEGIETKRLPDAMAAVGMKEFMLTDGSKITIKKDYHASIPKARKIEAHTWLRDNEFGALVKNELTIEFGKGQDEEAADAYATLKAEYPDQPVTLAESVHASTLKALVKEQFESGSPLPEDLFGIHIIDRAIIK